QCHFIVISRPGYHLEDAKNVLGGKHKTRMQWVSDSERIEEEVFERCRIFLLSIPTLDLSSCEVRRRIKHRESIAGQVAEPVEAYINKNKLYQ
ncbi:MAG: nicotinate (nicotinamide) nucleotide adenylyltransferase, partial [Candidatus Aminicenantes bacterium]|nr:nicotinate (nicotinamide) nucleotide adenylyltransferase [Candidatus Aminicenantes bacterium]